MERGARTPEELDTLLEDAFVVRDVETLAGLFEDSGVLVNGCGEARGRAEIRRMASEMWRHDRHYFADPDAVLQSRGLALVVARRATSVVRRGGDGVWRYAIALLSDDETTTKEEYG